VQLKTWPVGSYNLYQLDGVQLSVKAVRQQLANLNWQGKIYLQTYRHDMTYSVLKVPLNPNQPTNHQLARCSIVGLH